MSWYLPPQTKYASIAAFGMALEPHALGEAVVGHDVGAGDQAGCGARQERDDARHFFRRAHAARGDLAHRRIVELLVGALDHFPGATFEIDRARAQRINAHVELADEL